MANYNGLILTANHRMTKNFTVLMGREISPLKTCCWRMSISRSTGGQSTPEASFDNRPTKQGVEGLEPHGTPVFSIRNARNVTMKGCVARWGEHRQEYFTNALEVENVQGLKIEHFTGEAAFPGKCKAIEIR
jgi:hypothetical protein